MAAMRRSNAGGQKQLAQRVDLLHMLKDGWEKPCILKFLKEVQLHQLRRQQEISPHFKQLLLRSIIRTTLTIHIASVRPYSLYVTECVVLTFGIFWLQLPTYGPPHLDYA